VSVQDRGGRGGGGFEVELAVAVRTIDLAPYPGAPVGSSPNAVAVSPNGRTLYVANAGDNDVAVVTLAHHRQPGEDADGATGPAPDAPTPDAETPDAPLPTTAARSPQTG
jgi:DNA-binding beta-propeller fold protein YncE